MQPYYEHAGITIHHGDCREILPELQPDSLLIDSGKKADLLCTDPPYGIGIGRSSHKSSGLVVGHGHRRVAKRSYDLAEWDDAPVGDYLIGILRSATRHQIIFGGNYFSLPPSRCWLVWDKEVNGNFADCELAWTNLDRAVKKITWLWNGFARRDNEERYDHPTQKPLGLLMWCIEQAPPTCQSVLDPFMGTGTTLVAAKQLGRRACGIEIEERYCEIAAKRLSQEVFDFTPTP